MTFSEQLIYLIDEFAKHIGIIIDWTNTNIMPYLQDLFGRYIGYQIAIKGICVGLSIIGVIATIVFGRLAYKEADSYGSEMPYFVLAIFTGILSVVGLACVIPALLEIIFVPEFHIYQQLSHLM